MTTYDFGDGNGQVPAHQHANGGGWVADTAYVEGTAYVGPDAKVYGSAWVCGSARVYGSAWVSDSARVYGSAAVYGSALVSEICTRTPKALTGFTHVLTITDHHVRAGCECHPPSVWLNRGEAIIRAAGIPSKAAKAQAAIIAALIEQHGCTDLPEEPK